MGEYVGVDVGENNDDPSSEGMQLGFIVVDGAEVVGFDATIGMVVEGHGSKLFGSGVVSATDGPGVARYELGSGVVSATDGSGVARYEIGSGVVSATDGPGVGR